MFIRGSLCCLALVSLLQERKYDGGRKKNPIYLMNSIARKRETRIASITISCLLFACVLAPRNALSVYEGFNAAPHAV